MNIKNVIYLPFEPFSDTKIQVQSKTKVASWFRTHLEIDLIIRFYTEICRYLHVQISLLKECAQKLFKCKKYSLIFFQQKSSIFALNDIVLR